MKNYHVPIIDSRYWAGITLASIFGTNLGDLYAHESGLGLIGGLPVLGVLFAGIFFVERLDRRSHDVYYWLCIIVMRTGATNIADYMAGRRGLNIDRLTLSICLGMALVALAWWAAGVGRNADGQKTLKSVPDTNIQYWLAMLTAGVFGTVLGDYVQRSLGQGIGAAVLSVALAVALLIYGRSHLRAVYVYWLVVGVARTTGTAIGDWLAENHFLMLGLPLSTFLTGLAFISLLVLWRGRSQPVM